MNVLELFETLPDYLAERIRGPHDCEIGGQASFVLYWMRTAMRGHENPALDLALASAERLKLPLLVYQGLSERYRFASDRHHTFILQGARDVQAELTARGINYCFHLEREGFRAPCLRQLGEMAALIVTEEMPVQPLRKWSHVLSASVKSPLFYVDTACVVPMRLVGKAYERAFAYRDATRLLYEERIARHWQEMAPSSRELPMANLPIEPLLLQQSDLSALMATCDIDHAVAPVPRTPGGSSAGYARWESFKARGLQQYASRRNDPLRDGTSRISPYLHYGMISPFRIAREAAAVGGRGAEKFLDELLIWRELAHVFCFYRSDHHRMEALPRWAQQTLADHQQDERPAIHSWETLARGQTGDPLWDAAQKSLLIHGELHNNVRMTWGKAILNWTPDAKTALKTILDLNHRYALDGRDPSSYGGILWCLGQFDRPFQPEQPIIGSVRPRPTSVHAQRLDVAKYQARCARPFAEQPPRVAVIGAGISGLFAARTLCDHGVPVTIFDKGRGVGGRMATRRSHNGLSFDHGAQYFTIRDKHFARYARSWLADGIIAQWNGRVGVIKNGEIAPSQQDHSRYVGVPAMNSVCKHLARDLTVESATRVAKLTRTDTQWQLHDDHDASLGEFAWTIVTAPAPQAAELLADVAPHLSAKAAKVPMQPCWALMVEFADPLPLQLDGAFVHESPLAWVARNSSKPGREVKSDCWVLHASPEWSKEFIEDDEDEVGSMLLSAFWQATGLAEIKPVSVSVHRWRFALPQKPLFDRCLFDSKLQIAICGDWCAGARVEGAFLSGLSAAGTCLRQVAESTKIRQQLALF